MRDAPPTDELAAVIDRTWARCEAAVREALREAKHDDDFATLIALGLISRLAGCCLDEIMGLPGRTDLADLVAADADDVHWAIEAIANLDLEALANRTSASLMLKRRLL